MRLFPRAKLNTYNLLKAEYDKANAIRPLFKDTVAPLSRYTLH